MERVFCLRGSREGAPSAESALSQGTEEVHPGAGSARNSRAAACSLEGHVSSALRI